jgi:hypothetical protein
VAEELGIAEPATRARVSRALRALAAVSGGEQTATARMRDGSEVTRSLRVQ